MNIIEVHLFVCYIRDINILQRTDMERVKISIICCKLTEFFIRTSFAILQFLAL